MTDKQIIIDGVDVSGCKHYKNRTCIADYCLTDMPFGEAKCELSPNCYYKQLQREKQNSQEARDVAIKEFNRVEELKTLLKRKEQECEELKAEIKHYKQIAQYHGNLSVKYTNKSARYKQTLIKIKDIAEQISLPMGTGKSSNRVILANQILQKVSEVENE